MNKSDLVKMTILLISSNQALIDKVGKDIYLRYYQHNVLFGSGRTDSIEHVNANPDICIVDMYSPPENISLIITELSRQHKIGQTILLCPHTTKSLASYGFRYFIPNPINIDTLSTIIDTLAIETFFKRYEALRR